MEQLQNDSGTDVPANEANNKQDLFYLDETDLVKIVSLDVIATVEHIGGESSSEEDSDESSMEDDDSDSRYRMYHRYAERHLRRAAQAANTAQKSNDMPNSYDEIPSIVMFSDQEDEQSSADENEDIDFNDNLGEDNGNNANGKNGNDDENENIEYNNDNDDNGDDNDDDVDDVDYDDDDEDPKVIPIGSALVCRIDNGEEVVVPINDLKVVDRIFAPGQLILSAVQGDSNVQTGIIQNLKKKLTVRRMADWDPTNKNESADVFEIPAEDVAFFCDVRIDSYIVCRNWLGVVEFCQVEVYVDFPDGSIAVVPGHPERLVSDDPRVSGGQNPDFEGFFFPGMKVKASSRVWRVAKWLRGKYRRQRSGIVRYTKTTSVGVQWMAVRQNSGASHNDAPPKPPSDVVPYSEVRPLDTFRSLWWRPGDFALLPSKKTSDEEQWVEQTTTLPTPHQTAERSSRPRSSRRHPPHGTGRLISAQRRTRELSALEDPESSDSLSVVDPSAVIQILETRTIASVLWQNGEVEHNIPSVNLRDNEHPGASDFWPGMIVSRAKDNVEPKSNSAIETKSSGDQGNLVMKETEETPSSNRRNELTGTVVRVDIEERTAAVRWQKPNSREYHSDEEEVSVYDLTAGWSDDMQLGDTVLLVSEEGSIPSDPNKEVRWIGQIVDKEVGNLEVQWLGGERTRVRPDQVLVVGERDDSVSDDTSVDVDMDEIALHREGMGLTGAQNVTDPALRDNWSLGESAPVNLDSAIDLELRVVFEYSSRLSKSVFSREVEVSDSDRVLLEAIAQYADRLDPEKEITSARVIQKFVHSVAFNVVTHYVNSLSGGVGSVSESVPKEGNTGTETATSHPSWNTLKLKIREAIRGHFEEKGISLPSTKEVEPNTTHGDVSEQVTVAETEGNKNDAASYPPMETEFVPSPSNPNEEEMAQPFEVVENLERHHFSGRSTSVTGHGRLPGFANIVRKEWIRLRKNLPEGIYVHACEQQQDLLRVAIIGPRDTPYEDVMFFFDILLGCYYPAEPPRVNFLSHGRRLNPNLYEDGKVCLSILGTWDGDDVEVWDPRNSNVLRVLLSLQAMVFVEEPYYNEAGYQKQVGTVEGMTNSRTYNESTLLLCVRHLIQSVRAGGAPSDFVEFQRKHYLNNAERIVERLKKLSVVQAPESGPSTSSPSGCAGAYTSKGFKRSLTELIPRVLQVFQNLESSSSRITAAEKQ